MAQLEHVINEKEKPDSISSGSDTAASRLMDDVNHARMDALGISAHNPHSQLALPNPQPTDHGYAADGLAGRDAVTYSGGDYTAHAVANVLTLGTMDALMWTSLNGISAGFSAVELLKDAHKLANASSNRELWRYGTSVAADLGMSVGAVMQLIPQERAIGRALFVASSALQLGADFIPYRPARSTE